MLRKTITVADVSGKGIPAAMFMVIGKTILNKFAKTFYSQNGLAAVVEAAQSDDITMFALKWNGSGTE